MGPARAWAGAARRAPAACLVRPCGALALGRPCPGPGVSRRPRRSPCPRRRPPASDAWAPEGCAGWGGARGPGRGHDPGGSSGAWPWPALLSPGVEPHSSCMRLCPREDAPPHPSSAPRVRPRTRGWLRPLLCFLSLPNPPANPGSWLSRSQTPRPAFPPLTPRFPVLGEGLQPRPHPWPRALGLGAGRGGGAWARPQHGAQQPWAEAHTSPAGVQEGGGVPSVSPREMRTPRAAVGTQSPGSRSHL